MVAVKTKAVAAPNLNQTNPVSELAGIVHIL